MKQQTVEKLKAERVQEELKAQGWRLVPGATAVDRSVEFPDSQTASSYAGFVNDFADRHAQPAQVVLCGKKVVVTLRGRRVAGPRTELNDEVLDFARVLGLAGAP
jgi:hypothetical protein